MNTFSTSDLTLSSTLLYLGFPIEALNRLDPQRVEFHFSNKFDLHKAIKSFHKGEIQVEPKRYFACIKEIKNRIYSVS